MIAVFRLPYGFPKLRTGGAEPHEIPNPQLKEQGHEKTNSSFPRKEK